MYLFTRTNLTKSNILNFLLALFPLSFIAGNMLININLLLIVILSLIFFNKELFRIKIFLLDKIIFFYFFLIIFTSFINDYQFFTEQMAWKGYFSTVKKSIYFLKYLLLYLSLRFLIEKNIINLKLFFISCSVATLFVSLDIFIQFIFEKDLFGFEVAANSRKLSGPFGDELIAGGFIQRFCIFSFFVLPFFYPNNSKVISKYVVPVLFVIFFVGIILSGNRMPLMLFIFTIFLILIFNNQTRKLIFPFVIIFTLLFTIALNFNSTIKANFKNFYSTVSIMSEIVVNNDFQNIRTPMYLKEFETFYETWLMNKYIGGGIKNFRYYCHERPNIDGDLKKWNEARKKIKYPEFICNMHPHNYYLEILTETGILGLITIFCIFMGILYVTFVKKYFLKSALNNNYIIIPFIFLFITEIFPIKSTGSFFTTGNTTYLFLIVGLMIGLARKNNIIENKIQKYKLNK